ncbi:copper resistance CopC/CopD family protein [Mesorhizobium shangrilense]|uniref:Copper resistance CopC/CopD family protein n=1 Tax=Mesorhizobium shangrilense TaxID=460060 RepID=A0ABV2DJJ4_9HYPH
MNAASFLQKTRTIGSSAGRLAVGVLFAVLLLAAVMLPGRASAHAALIATEPADGAVLAQSPAQFSLTFSEPVSPLVLTLVKPDGTPVALTAFRLTDQTIEIDNPQTLGRGTHVLSWRVISTDGHPIGGSVLFSVGAASEPPAVSEAVDWGLRSAIWTGKVFLYIGLFLGVGGAFALAWLAGAGRSGQRFVIAAILCGLVAAPLSLGLQGLDALGAPFARLAQPIIWRTALGTSFGSTVLIALMALGLGLLSLVTPRLIAKLLALAGLAGVGVALAASGHASAAEPQWLTRPMVFLHGIGIAFWAGALAPLGLALMRRRAEAGAFLHRFSLIILPVVAVLAAAGIVLAVIQVQTPSALVDTAYGRLLLIKLALLLCLFALAAFNRWRLTGPAEAGDAKAQGGLARSTGVEMLIVLAIFGIAAGWRFTPPPRALAIAAAQPASVHIHTLKAMADLSITPGHAGPVAASIVIMTGDFGPLDAKEVTLVLSKPDSGIEPLKRPATKPGDGSWRVDNLVIPVPGRWTARVDILVSDFEIVKIEAPIDIRP